MGTKNYINYMVFAFPQSHQFMKNIIFSFSLGFLMLSGVAIADTSKTSTTTTSKSTYDWTGVYVGGFVGGASGANVTSSTNGLIHAQTDFAKLLIAGETKIIRYSNDGKAVASEATLGQKQVRKI